MESLFYEEKFEPLQPQKPYQDGGPATMPFSLFEYDREPLAETAFMGGNQHEPRHYGDDVNLMDGFVHQASPEPFYQAMDDVVGSNSISEEFTYKQTDDTDVDQFFRKVGDDKPKCSATLSSAAINAAESYDEALPTTEVGSLSNGSSSAMVSEDFQEHIKDDLLLSSNEESQSMYAIEANTATYIDIQSQSSYQPSALDATHEQLPLISREGMRKAHSYHMGQADRLRKSGDQVNYLMRLYQHSQAHGGKVDRKTRKRAIKATGLSWIQIYKWLFDKKLKDTAAQKSLFMSSPQSIQIFRVIGKNGREIGKPAPIFKIEKVSRSSK